MTDAPNTEELVMLAEYCGYEEIKAHADCVLVGRSLRMSLVGYRPDLDATQRDELAAKLLADGWEVIQSTCPGDEWPYECELNKDQETQARLGVANTPGLALCRPTLEMLKAKAKG
jgi:hypothetical protein